VKKLWVWRAVFTGLIMGDKISEHSSASIKKVVRYYGFPECQEHEYPTKKVVRYYGFP
jgi:hypothetical protein